MRLSVLTAHDIGAIANFLPRTSKLAAMMRAAALRDSPAIHPAAFRTLARVLVAAKPESVAPIDENVFEVCETAMLEHRELRLGYTDAEAKVTVRRVEPHGLLLRRVGWLLVAFDHREEAPRTFRLDRVFRAWITNARFVPLDPRTLNERVVATVDGSSRGSRDD